MTQTPQSPYAGLFSTAEAQRKTALRTMARAFSLNTDYNHDLIYAYDTIQACLQHDRHFNPSQAELSLALFGQPRLQQWFRRLQQDFSNHELILNWEITNNWECQQGLESLKMRFLGYSFYLHPRVGAFPTTDFEDDEFPLIQEYIDTIHGPFVDYRGNNSQTLIDWMFEEVGNDQNPKFFNTTQRYSQRDLAKLSKPKHHRPLSEVLKGVI